MADEQIDELIIDVSVKGAEQANRQFDTMSQKIDELRRAIPKFDESLSQLANSFSTSQAGKSGSNTTQSIKNAANSVDKLSDRWKYLDSPVEILNHKIRRLTDETDRFKKAWQETDDTEAQDKLANKIEANTDKIRKLTAEKENLEQSGNETGGGLQGLLSNVQGIAAMFGKTGGQISGLIGKASNLGGVLQGVAGKAAGIAIPVGIIVGLVSAIKKGAEAIMRTAKTVYSVAKKIANVIGKEIKNKINELVEPIKRIKDRIGRVIFNRLIREAFNLIQNGIAEGLKNVARGVDRANVALSQYSTQITYLKNTIGAMFIPVLETLYPFFD